MTIVTEFGKSRYNCLPMGMCASVDIFQAKVEEMIGDIEGVKTYIDDILVLSQYILSNHIEKLSIIFDRLRTEGLKSNALNCSYGIKEIPYLGYVITWEVIKPDLKTLQGIMDLRRPNTTTEARVLIGMVQYYRYMCPRRSHVLAPLEEADSGPKDK